MDLGALPGLWAEWDFSFLLIACCSNRRNEARILPQMASGVSAFALLVAVVLVSLVPGDLPAGWGARRVGLAWLGFSLWTEKREPSTDPPRSGECRPSYLQVNSLRLRFLPSLEHNQ